MRKRLFLPRAALLLMAFLAIQSTIWAQTRISGSVTNSNDKSALAGVSVMVKGTNTGTSTDANGNYTINASSGTTLVLVLSDMVPKRFPSEIRPKLDVALAESAEALQEVVVTALGIKKESKKLGYATTTINAEALTETAPLTL